MGLFDLALTNLVSPPILFFALGLVAALIRSDLAVPEAVAKSLSIFLIMAIGFKGGVEMASASLSDAAMAIGAGILISFALPFISFGLLRATSRTGRVDAAAIAAHYGSISIVTFIAASDAGNAMGLAAAGFMVAVAAAMEAPAIFSGLILAGKQEGQSDRELFREVAVNGSIVLLVGAFLIGWATGETGREVVEPLFYDVFRGVLCIFLLDMGLVAGRGLVRQAGALQWPVILHGLYMPVIGASLGLFIAWIIGLAPGTGALLMTLSASASYIAVPAAMRLALPKAKPAVALTLSLGVTFPFNLVFGIPIYFAIARAVLG
ncbi:sodium-dependent bicarbonate transport family permease [Hyphobacterium sp. HN65]|uniref:Sodium-dependent bicarbonate transport family permease n=1 Tax=Hyphobacterium lacteum TaxID=3116575 RepID=A0ABU7LTW6_9PROT|nr:sodium-dependent bicarbonate transport family permease [Hyphobacterium sp. HN65]MEE2527348.1 sodium-dependent bicarbonate transport family permease [Hyphobacterium sp. HN65]